MDELKHGKFIVVSIHTEREEKTSISSVDYFMISELFAKTERYRKLVKH